MLSEKPNQVLGTGLLTTFFCWDEEWVLLAEQLKELFRSPAGWRGEKNFEKMEARKKSIVAVGFWHLADIIESNIGPGVRSYYGRPC